MWRGGLVATLLALLPATGWALSLEEAMERAVTNPEATALLRSEVARAEAEARTSLGALLPRLSVQAGVSRTSAESRLPGADDSPWSFSSSATATMDLFQGTALPTRWAAEASADAARAQADWEAATLRRTAGRLYLTALTARANVEAAQQAVVIARETLRQVEVRYELGFAVASDVSQARLAVLRAESAVLDSEVTLENTLEELAWLLDVQAVRQDELRPPDLREVPETGGRLAQLLALDAQLDAASRRVQAQRWSLLPSANVQGTWAWGRGGTRGSEGDGDWTLSFNLQWVLFDYARYGRIDAAQASLDGLQATLSQTERRNRTELGLAERQLRRAEEREQLAIEAVGVAQESVALVRTRYELGEGTMLELTAAEVDAFDAQTQRNVAKLQRDLAWLDLAWQRGALGGRQTSERGVQGGAR